jgi:hypothetical protein
MAASRQHNGLDTIVSLLDEDEYEECYCRRYIIMAKVVME